MIVIISEQNIYDESNSKWLQTNFPFEKVLFIKLESNDSDHHIITALDTYNMLKNSYDLEDYFFIGHSQGCKIAEYLANATGSSAILINPTISPRILLPRKVTNDLYYFTYMDSKFKESSEKDSDWLDEDSMVLVVGTDDCDCNRFESLPNLKSNIKEYAIHL
jgi:predicted esterase YcpF (UPF0227 family)